MLGKQTKKAVIKFIIAYIVLLIIFHLLSSLYVTAYLPLISRALPCFHRDYHVTEMKVVDRGGRQKIEFSIDIKDRVVVTNYPDAVKISYTPSGNYPARSIINYPLILFSLIAAWPF